MGKGILSLIGHEIIDTLYVAFCTTIYLYSRILVLRSTGSFSIRRTMFILHCSYVGTNNEIIIVVH